MKDRPASVHHLDAVDSLARTVAELPSAELDVDRVHAEHAPYVWLTLQRFGVRGADLDDVLQEVFVVVYQRRATYSPEASLRSWLYGICLRVVSAWRRRAFRRRETVTDDPAAQLAAVDDASNPEAASSRREAQAQLAAVLDAMDIERRAVFVMFEIEDLACDAIAETIGIPVGTVYSRLHAARREFEKLAERARARHRTGGRP